MHAMPGIIHHDHPLYLVLILVSSRGAVAESTSTALGGLALGNGDDVDGNRVEL
jgi:hypothetical protein